MAEYDLEAQADAAAELAPISQGGSGQEVTLTTPVQGTFDPETDTGTPAQPLVQQSSGLEEAYSAHSIDGTRVQAGDKKFLLSPLKLDGTLVTAPVADSSILALADGSPWLVKKVDALSPAGRPVMYTLQLRGAS